MILFYASGASSQAPHILFREAQLPVRLERVDLATHLYEGGDYRKITPKSYVPALLLDDGQVLTECAVILQFIADLVPEQQLMPEIGTTERYHALEWLNFIATELHKNFITPERHGGVAANFLSKTLAGQAETRLHVSPRLAYVDHQLEGRPFLMGERLTAPDAYLFTMLAWARRLSIELMPWPNLFAFFERMMIRPAVQDALAIEGKPHTLLENG